MATIKSSQIGTQVLLTTASSAGTWTNIRSVGIVYQTADGAWRLRFNVNGSITGLGSNNIFKLVSLTGVVFKSTAHQAIAVRSNGFPGSGFSVEAHCEAGGDGLRIQTSSTVTPANADWHFSGDVELNAKPSFIA